MKKEVRKMEIRSFNHDDGASTDLFYIGGKTVGIYGDGGESIEIFETKEEAKEFFEEGGIYWGEMSHKSKKSIPVSAPSRYVGSNLGAWEILRAEIERYYESQMSIRGGN